MDDNLRAEIADLCLAVDVMVEDDERAERQRTKQRNVGELVYKTNENALVEKQQAEPDAPVADEWLNDLADAIGGALGELRADLETQITELRSEIASLRAEMTAARSTNVTSMMKRDRDVA